MRAFKDEPAVVLLDYGPATTQADINIWHQDHSYRTIPTRYELSYADVCPEAGGDVMFADSAAAHDSLSPRLRTMLCGCTDPLPILSFCSPTHAPTLTLVGFSVGQARGCQQTDSAGIGQVHLHHLAGRRLSEPLRVVRRLCPGHGVAASHLSRMPCHTKFVPGQKT